MASAFRARTDAAGTVRLGLRIAALLTTLAVLVLLHLLWRAVRLPSPWPRLFLAASGRIIGARRRIVGTPLRRNVVFVANHLSWIDIQVLAGATGCAFVAKADLREVPLIGWLCGLNHTIFVRREDRMAVTAQIDALRTAFSQGWAVTMFPEGTTGDGVTLLPFKASLLAALDPPPPGVVVQPVRIDYGEATRELAWVGDEPGPDHARRVVSRAGSFAVTLTFLVPFDPAMVGGRKALAAEARRRIEAAGLQEPPQPA